MNPDRRFKRAFQALAETGALDGSLNRQQRRALAHVRIACSECGIRIMAKNLDAHLRVKHQNVPDVTEEVVYP